MLWKAWHGDRERLSLCSAKRAGEDSERSAEIMRKGFTYKSIPFDLLVDTRLRCGRCRWPQSPVDRFWSYVDKSGGDDACWIWTGPKIKDNYGRFHLREQKFQAHRVSYAIAHGGLESDVLICHHCDNPPCVNPKHLFIGTHRDNNLDKLEKGRAGVPYGEQHWASKLTPDAVRMIRASQKTQRRLAAEFGVSQDQISAIKRREAWRHVE